MKVVIDARWIDTFPSGVGVYTQELLRHIPRMEPAWDFHLFFKNDEIKARVLDECRLGELANVTSEVLPYGIFSLMGQLRLPRKLKALGADIFHSTNYMIPYLAFNSASRHEGGCRAIATIHDVIPLVVPNHAPRSLKSKMPAVFRQSLRQSVRHSSSVITVSETSRNDMVKVLKLRDRESGRIKVVYNGVDKRFVPSRKTLPDSLIQTILYVGRLDPYKNVVTLVRAFGQLLRRTREPLQLLIVGSFDRRYPEARQVVNDLGLQDQVAFLGFIDDSKLVSIYQESALLVNPSCYEGFGLQLIEAMRCDVPVVCCDGGAQPEVVGDAALVVPPKDARALADAMQKALFDEDERASLIARGRVRSQRFNWEDTARDTLQVYKDVAASDRGER